MGSFFNKINNILLNNNGGSNEDNIARIFLLTGIVLSGLALITGLINQLPLIMNLPNMFLMIICFILTFVIRKNTFKNSLYGLYFVAFIYFPFIYLTNGGIYGAGIFYFVMIIVYFSFYKKGRSLVIFLILLISYYTFLIVFSFNNPVYVVPYPDERALLIDMIINFIAVTIIMTLVTSVVYRSYESEKNKVTSVLETLKEQNTILEDFSNRDSLTKVFNRQYFQKIIPELLMANRITEESFYLMMIDIDCFKKINDIYGHIVGDKVLIKVADILKSTVMTDDLVIRYGGEEFVVIVKDSYKIDGRDLAERIRENVEQAEFSNNIKVTVSIGVSRSNKEDNEESIVERSDIAMYKVKNSGRNGVSINY